jgi:hypothetical protein
MQASAFSGRLSPGSFEDDPMANQVRTRRFLPVVESLSLRLAPTNLCPMVTTVLPPELPPDPVVTCPMQTTLVNTVISPLMAPGT